MVSILTKIKGKIKDKARTYIKKILEDEITIVTFSSEGSIDTAQSAEGLRHSRNYSKLLETYVKSTKTNIRMKNLYKFFFFVITMGLLVGVAYFLRSH